MKTDQTKADSPTNIMFHHNLSDLNDRCVSKIGFRVNTDLKNHRGNAWACIFLWFWMIAVYLKLALRSKKNADRARHINACVCRERDAYINIAEVVVWRHRRVPKIGFIMLISCLFGSVQKSQKNHTDLRQRLLTTFPRFRVFFRSTNNSKEIT